MARGPRVSAPHFRQRYHPPGTAPGTYDAHFVREAAAPRITVIDYDADHLNVLEGEGALRAPRSHAGGVRWVHVGGRPSPGVLREVNERYGVHDLALEDVVLQGQRPKLNIYEEGVFATLMVARPGVVEGTPHGVTHEAAELVQQLNVFVGEGLLVSFVEEDAELMRPLRARIEAGRNRLRHGDAFFLFYAIVDLVVDQFFPVLDRLGSELSALEEHVLETPDRLCLHRAHALRSELLVHRRAVWATRELLSDLFRYLDADDERHRAIRPFLEDVYDHLLGASDHLESYREVAASIVEVYLSVVSNRLNDIMRVLTIIATIFIPPTFIVGIYGMNFDRGVGPLSMPELGWPLAYVGVMLLCFAIMGALLVFFRRRKWL